MHRLISLMVVALLSFSTSAIAYDDAPKSVVTDFNIGIKHFVNGQFESSISVLDNLRKRIFRQYRDNPSVQIYDSIGAKTIAYSYAYKYIRGEHSDNLNNAKKYFRMAVAKGDKWSRYTNKDGGIIYLLQSPDSMKNLSNITKDNRGVVKKKFGSCSTDLSCYLLDMDILTTIGNDETAIADTGDEWYVDNKCLRERLVQGPVGEVMQEDSFCNKINKSIKNKL